ncbi:MAG: hypothetical protein SFV32_04260 [Opitutaceae bacterium]|nr:hypothetical protein [Opitutaceae bacterium]
MLPVSITKSLLMAASIGIVVPVHAATGRYSRLAQAEETPKRKPKREDTAPVVPGVIVPRKDGRFIALAVEDNRFVLRFLDEGRRQIEPGAVRASARWEAVGLSGEERAVLNPATDGLSLVGAPNVKRPYRFKVYLSLLDENGESIENFQVDMRQL